MLPQRLDTTLAHKGIALSPELSGAEKRVASAIIDSFNRKTGQCDPSFDRIAHLLGISRRSVIRAINKLESLRLILRDRHGGKSQRNAYQPNWSLFRGMDNAWSAHQKTRHWDSGLKESPLWCHEQQSAGGEDATQTTSLLNQSKETSGDNANHPPTSPETVNSAKGKSPTYVSHSAALAAAERRWFSDLHKRYANNKAIYAQILDAVTSEIAAAATQAEVNRRGAGLAYIEDALMNAEIERSLWELIKSWRSK
jgi:hypothetical protein